MNNKLKILFFALGVIVFLAASAFLWYRIYHEDLSAKQPGAGTKEIINNSSSNANKESGALPEQKPEEKRVSQESTNSSSSDLDQDKASDENSKKFNSNKDEEETNDGVTVEVEPDDE